MRQWIRSLKLWLGSAAILTSLLLAVPSAFADPDKDNKDKDKQDIPTPEPATLTLLALGGAGAALVRYRKSRQSKKNPER